MYRNKQITTILLTVEEFIDTILQVRFTDANFPQSLYIKPIITSIQPYIPVARPKK